MLHKKRQREWFPDSDIVKLFLGKERVRMNLGGWTYRQEYVKCGKRSCKKCPHGPYWYAYRQVKGKLQKRYVGKWLPGESAEKPVEKPAPPNRLDAIFSKQGCCLNLAFEILGIRPMDVGKLTSDEKVRFKKQFRALTMKFHPDRGGDDLTYRRITAAWTYICGMYDI